LAHRLCLSWLEGESGNDIASLSLTVRESVLGLRQSIELALQEPTALDRRWFDTDVLQRSLDRLMARHDHPSCQTLRESAARLHEHGSAFVELLNNGEFDLATQIVRQTGKRARGDQQPARHDAGRQLAMNRPTTHRLACWLVAIGNERFDSTTRRISHRLRAVAEQSGAHAICPCGGRVVIVPTKLNERLRLAACPQALQARLPNRGNSQFACRGGRQLPRQRRLDDPGPVQLQVYRQVLVTSRPLARGDSVGLGDVHSEERDITRTGLRLCRNSDQIAGRSLARPLIGGHRAGAGPPQWRETVRAGDQVELDRPARWHRGAHRRSSPGRRRHRDAPACTQRAFRQGRARHRAGGRRSSGPYLNV
jgi:flagella basal body P-ring formation protein FlgA